MKGGIGNLMKQAQLMQENMKRVQEQLGQMEVEGQAGSGMVKVLMTCKHDVRRVSIDPRLLSDERRRTGHAGRSRRGRVQRRGAAG